MQWQTNPYFAPIFIAGLIALVCALFIALRGSKVSGSASLLGLISSITVWAFTYAFELASAKQEWEVFWSKAEYMGIPFVPLFFFIFAYEFTQNSGKLHRKIVSVIAAPAFIFLLLAWTNEYHGLIWSKIGQKDMGGYYLLSLEHGVAFWILIAYSYILLLAGLIVIIRRVISSPPEFKQQSFIILIGAGLTWLGNVIYISGLSPVPELDLTPISFVISSVIFSFGLFRFGILDIMPIAGESVLESMDDIVIVINPKGNLVYVNHAFDYYFRVAPLSLIGRQVADALAPWPLLRTLTDNANTIRKEITITTANQSVVIFDVRIFNIRLRANDIVGRVITLRDITERRAAENRLNQQQPQDAGSGEIPMMVMYRTSDDKIVDVNRTFLINLGFERRDVLGRTLIEIKFWGLYQRADFLRALYKEGNLKDHAFTVGQEKEIQHSYIFSASLLEIQGINYVVMLAREDFTGK
jgi:PAS domain S-box-containing protein